MKRFLGLFLAILLWGCSSADLATDRFLALRQVLQSAQGCSFRSIVTSDNGDYYHSFVLDCSFDGQKMTFEVVSPESISGITGQFRDASGALTFDDKILVLEPLADGQIPPISAPWILLRSLIGGYMEAASDTEDGLMLYLRETYADDAVNVHVLLDGNDLPSRAEIIWQGRRILTLDVENFVLE